MSAEAETDRLLRPSRRLLMWYQCGPTVYDDAHLGHARTSVTFDMVRRVLQHRYDRVPVLALSVTDIDDKVVRRAREVRTARETATEAALRVARLYERRYFEDMRRLNVLPPTCVLRVSEHIPAIVQYVEQLVAKGAVYSTRAGNFYFDTTRVQHRYGVLDAGRQWNAEWTAADVGDHDDDDERQSPGDKRHRADFAVWKAVADPEQEASWPSPRTTHECTVCRGRPGWHVECSAMCAAVFGDQLDLHTGGVDLRFPHHENEIHLSEAYHGVERWCAHWMHTGALLSGREKMSKSLRNFVTVRQYLQRDGDDSIEDTLQVRRAVDVFRIFCALHKYSTPAEFTAAQEQHAGSVWQRLAQFVERSGEGRNRAAAATAPISSDASSSAAAAAEEEEEEASKGMWRRWRGAAGNVSSPSSSRTQERIHACQQQIDAALAADFHFPRVIHALLQLVNDVNRCDVGDGEPDEMALTGQWVRHILGTLGMASAPFAVTSRQASSAEDGVTAVSPEQSPESASAEAMRTAQVESLVRFRCTLRQAIREELRELPSGDARNAQRRLLQLCDQLRDEVLLKAYGVQVADRPDGNSSWTRCYDVPRKRSA